MNVRPKALEGIERRVFAALYDPVTARFERAVLGRHRAGLLRELGGAVLDIGAGTGANLAHYERATRVVLVEPDPWMRRRLARRASGARVPVEIHDDPAESLHFADASFDAVVCTCVLCSVTDLGSALAEAWRVLRPSGQLIVLEHVRGEGRIATWQDRVDPLWSRVAGGCHPNRAIADAVERTGFVFDTATTFDPMPGWLVLRPWLRATARKRGWDPAPSELARTGEPAPLEVTSGG